MHGYIPGYLESKCVIGQLDDLCDLYLDFLVDLPR